MKKEALRNRPVQYSPGIPPPQGESSAQRTATRRSAVVKFVVTGVSESVYTATARLYELASVPFSGEPLVTRVGPLQAKAHRGLIFTCNGEMPSKAAIAVECKNGDVLIWRLADTGDLT